MVVDITKGASKPRVFVVEATCKASHYVPAAVGCQLTLVAFQPFALKVPPTENTGAGLERCVVIQIVR